MAARVFLSYRWADRWARDRVTDSLSSIGVATIEYPADEIDANWKPIAESQIASSDGVVVLLGPTTLESDPINWEIGIAKRLDKHVVGVRVIDTNLDQASPIQTVALDSSEIQRVVKAW
jgi:nucleoside 2-deoxyribosyltransferase